MTDGWGAFKDLIIGIGMFLAAVAVLCISVVLIVWMIDAVIEVL